MEWLYRLLLVLGIASGFVIFFIYQHKRLLQMWKDVTLYEVKFYRQLEKVVKLYYQHLDSIATLDNKECATTITRYRKKRIRSLLLQKRQDLYNAITLLFDEVENSENEVLIPLKSEYQELQKVRRIYNSKVLIYNQTINVFPTRYLALRMNLEMKEYFG
jgi:hypothetical protein